MIFSFRSSEIVAAKKSYVIEQQRSDFRLRISVGSFSAWSLTVEPCVLHERMFRI